MLRRRANRQRQRVNTLGEFVGQDLVDHTLAFNARCSLESGRDNLHAEVRFAFWAGPYVAGMKVRFIDDIQMRGRKCVGQFDLDRVGNAHALFVRMVDRSWEGGEVGMRCQVSANATTFRKVPTSSLILGNAL